MNFPSIPYDEGMFGLDFQTYWNRSTEERIEPAENDSSRQTDIAELRSLSLESWKNDATKETEAPSVDEEAEVLNTDIVEKPNNPELSLVKPKANEVNIWFILAVISIIIVVPALLFYRTITEYWYGHKKSKYRE